jgi:transposase InsO family protein
MSKARVVVSKIISKQMSASEAAVAYGVSRQHVHRWLARYRDRGFDGLEPRSRRPHSNPRRTASGVAERIVALRRELAAQGLDHGPQTIGWHLEHEQLPVPSTSTIRRILVAAGLVTAEPRKRPKSSYRRFEADQPNECWQSDFTHWQLADGTGVEIINWLDDHSRYLLASRVYRRVTGPIVISTFLTAGDTYGPPQSTLTDNGSVYTSRFTGGRNGFEYLLANLGITQKNGHPGHPQTQGKIERFHQTLKRWLAAQPAAATPDELQAQLDRFQRIYNELRPTGR